MFSVYRFMKQNAILFSQNEEESAAIPDKLTLNLPSDIHLSFSTT